jgi:hypothetical protein
MRPPRPRQQKIARALVGREVAAPNWSAACTPSFVPRPCDEPVWVYGSPAYVSRFKCASEDWPRFGGVIFLRLRSFRPGRVNHSEEQAKR